MDFEMKLAEIRTKPGNNSAKRRKYLLLWTAIILILLISTCLLTSLGQTLLTNSKYVITENTTPKFLIDNPVFSPLVRSSRLNNAQFLSGAHIIYNGSSMSTPSIALSGLSNATWWISENEDTNVEINPIPEAQSLPLQNKFVYQDLHPRLRTRTTDFPVITRESIPAGIADLLTFLREKDFKRQAEQEPDASKTNPFEEALKKASHDGPSGKDQEAKASESAAQTQEHSKETAESKPTPEDAKENKASEAAAKEGKTEAYGSVPAGMGAFLFIGAFNNQIVATDIGTTTLNQLIQSAGNAITFDLAGAGKNAFDMSIIMRNRVNQESVAFGDLNLDGFPDIIITNKSTNNTTVYLNDRQGNYIPTSEIEGGFGPAAATISDFNGDGSPDVAVMLQTDKTIIVDGKGLRQFILPTSSINDKYESIIPYDFNGDGLTDLLLTNYHNLASTIYINCGKGIFSASSSFALQSFPMIQSSVDVDGDGIQDLVYIQYLGDHISIVIQNGRDGSIQCLGNMILDPAFYYVLGDFNLDGVIDIAIARPK
jgi:hypothetical protein